MPQNGELAENPAGCGVDRRGRFYEAGSLRFVPKSSKGFFLPGFQGYFRKSVHFPKFRLPAHGQIWDLHFTKEKK